MRLGVLCFSFLLALTSASLADDADTFDAMLALARKGNPEAEYHVGMMYNNGIGTPPDAQQAFEWFKKSAEANDPLGAYKLGCYYAGQFGVVQRDDGLALKYKLVAAEAGYALAQHDVAVHFARRGDFEKAAEWLALAGAQGFEDSLFGLSELSANGQGVARDNASAYAYFLLGLRMSQTEITSEVQARLGEMAARLDSTELAKADSMVADWQPRPTPLTLEAGRGIAAAEELLRETSE